MVDRPNSSIKKNNGGSSRRGMGKGNGNNRGQGKIKGKNNFLTLREAYYYDVYVFIFL